MLACAGFGSTFALRSVEPLVGVLARDLASNAHTVALLSTAFALPYAFIQPVLGPIGDALGKERVMSTCLAVLAVALTLCSVAPDLGSLFGLRMLAGAAAGGCIPLSLALLGDRVPMAGRQVAIGRFLVAVILGQLSGSTFAGLIEAAIGWRGVFAVTAAVAACACAATVFGFDRAGRAPARRPAFGEAVRRYRTILGNPRARVLFSAVFIEAIAIFGVFPHLAPLIEARGEGGPREAGLVLAGFAVGGLLYSALVGLLVRLLGLPRMLVGGGLICGASLTVVGLAGTWQVDCAALTAMGPRLLHAAQHLPDPGHRGRARRARLRGVAPRLLVLLRPGARRRGAGGGADPARPVRGAVRMRGHHPGAGDRHGPRPAAEAGVGGVPGMTGRQGRCSASALRSMAVSAA